MSNKPKESLKVVWRDGFDAPPGRDTQWTEYLFRLIDHQIALMNTGQRTARAHMIALMKELEYHIGFRYIKIDENYPDDERKG